MTTKLWSSKDDKMNSGSERNSSGWHSAEPGPQNPAGSGSNPGSQESNTDPAAAAASSSSTGSWGGGFLLGGPTTAAAATSGSTIEKAMAELTMKDDGSTTNGIGAENVAENGLGEASPKNNNIETNEGNNSDNNGDHHHHMAHENNGHVVNNYNQVMFHC